MAFSLQKLLSEIWDAIRGGDRDYTGMKMSKALFLLAIPMVLEMIMESIFAVVDIYFVAQLGPEAVAVVGITESSMTIVYAFGFGLSMATTALISRRIGEKKKEEARLTAWQAILSGLLVSLPFAFVGLLFSDSILSSMGADSSMIAEHGNYTVLLLSSNVIIMLLFIINAIFRSAGNAAVAMRVLITANTINILLDPILISGWWIFPEMGVQGAATATIIGRGTAVLLQFWMLFKGNKTIQLTREHLVLKLNVLAQLFKKSFGAVAQNIIATSSWIGLYWILGKFEDTVAMAGYTIAIRLIIFFILPSWGLANAASTLVGQNLGANQSEKAAGSVWLAAKANVILMGTVSLFLIFFPESFVGLFTKDESLLGAGSLALQIIGGGFAFYGLGMVMIQSHNGAGDTYTPTWIYLISFWLIELPLAYYLSLELWDDQKGVYWAIVIAEAFMSLIAMLVFMRGGWKKIKV
jgi:putative MATE family efflux protein